LAGKDVFVEKPLTLTVKEGQKLAELAKRKQNPNGRTHFAVSSSRFKT
jgi:predicted dehydrogenase